MSLRVIKNWAMAAVLSLATISCSEDAPTGTTSKPDDTPSTVPVPNTVPTEGEASPSNNSPPKAQPDVKEGSSANDLEPIGRRDLARSG